MSEPGHLFVVHGRIEHLVHDAAVVPVDRALRFNSSWDDLLKCKPEAPRTWPEGWGQVGTSNWILEVGDGDYGLVLERLERALADIAGKALRPLGGRTRTLVALPVLGIGLGGHRHEQGAVLQKLIDFAADWVSTHPMDMAVVTPDASVYAAAQFARRAHRSPLPEDSERLAVELGGRAQRDELALFLGAGVSIPAGLPSWGGLLEELAEQLDPSERLHLSELDSSTDQAELIQLTSPKELQQQVCDIVRREVRPALLHALLAGLDVRRSVTTNYDRLFETATEAAGLSIRSVMPRQSATGAQRWVLKMHGDIGQKDSIVLTRRHMVQYDAANRPSASVLQSLLLTHHLLVIGASLSDDNVVRLALEVQAYREWHKQDDSHKPFGTVLDASPEGDRARASLWRGQLAWHHLADDATTAPRALELFVDRVGLHASRNFSWLLDPRFEGLLTNDADQKIARQARDLANAVGRSSSAEWTSLRAALADHGAHVPRRSSARKEAAVRMSQTEQRF